jgi:large subunit ribosomal protein L9
MKVLLLKDVYKLGRAGDIKKVADGYGRNYLIPNSMALLATPGAIKQADHIRKVANESRSLLNAEMSEIAERLKNVKIAFGRKAGETGKLYGSVTTQMVCDELNSKFGVNLDRHQIEIGPIRILGEHTARIRLTIDMVPTVTIVVHREGENPFAGEEVKPVAKAKTETQVEVEPEAATEAKVEPEVRTEA